MVLGRSNTQCRKRWTCGLDPLRNRKTVTSRSIQQLQRKRSCGQAGTTSLGTSVATWFIPGVESPVHTFTGFEVSSIQVRQKGKGDDTFASRLFRNRMISYEFELNGKQRLPRFPEHHYEESSGCRYELLGVKINKKKSQNGGFTSFLFQNQKKATAYYVLVEKEGIEPINLQKELNKLAAFGRLKSSIKVASRLDLLVSPAKSAGGEGRHHIYELLPSYFETIPEVANEGCGFIPCSMIQEFLGGNKVGKRTFAIQVRLFSPNLGT
jgi:hypothetical protein